MKRKIIIAAIIGIVFLSGMGVQYCMEHITITWNDDSTVTKSKTEVSTELQSTASAKVHTTAAQTRATQENSEESHTASEFLRYRAEMQRKTNERRAAEAAESSK